MIYIITGSESYLIDKKLDEIIKQDKDFDLIKLDGSSKAFSYRELLDSITSVGLFSNKSLVLLKDPIFFKKKVEDKELDELIEYCKNPLYENDLVFYTYEDDFKKILKAYKDIAKNAQVIECKIEPKNFNIECINILKTRNIKMTKEAFNTLANMCNNSLSLFNQNIDVLSLYPDKIDEDVVNGLCVGSSEENVFNLINSLTDKDVTNSIKYANRILAIDNNINGLIALLANQLHFLYEVSYYDSIGDDTYTIMDKTNSKKQYRIDMAFKTLRNLNRKEIMSLLNKLSDLDFKGKVNSDIDDKLRLELFIVGLIDDK